MAITVYYIKEVKSGLFFGQQGGKCNWTISQLKAGNFSKLRTLPTFYSQKCRATKIIKQLGNIVNCEFIIKSVEVD